MQDWVSLESVSGPGDEKTPSKDISHSQNSDSTSDSEPNIEHSLVYSINSMALAFVCRLCPFWGLEKINQLWYTIAKHTTQSFIKCLDSRPCQSESMSHSKLQREAVLAITDGSMKKQQNNKKETFSVNVTNNLMYITYYSCSKS